MGIPAKPYPPGKTIAVGLAIAAAFALLSLFFLFLQTRNTDVRLSGEVIAVATDSVTIRSARGTETVLTFLPDTKLRGVASAQALAEGQQS